MCQSNFSKNLKHFGGQGLVFTFRFFHQAANLFEWFGSLTDLPGPSLGHAFLALVSDLIESFK